MTLQSRSKLAKIGGVASCLGRNHGDPRGKQGQAMLHETGNRDAILVRRAFGDRSERCPIASKQSACDPAGSEQANDAADDARKRDAQHQRDAGVGVGREIGRVGLSQRQLHRDKTASMEPTRAVVGRAAIQPNNTKVGVSAAISISRVVTRGSTPNR